MIPFKSDNLRSCEQILSDSKKILYESNKITEILCNLDCIIKEYDEKQNYNLLLDRMNEFEHLTTLRR